MKKFVRGDIAQHMVGGFLLAGPFVVTEEVWRLAENMGFLGVIVNVVIVLGIGYGALYKAEKRDMERERKVLGIPARFLSLIAISYLSVAALVFTFSAPETFGSGTVTTVKAISIAAIFSVIGAATADTLF